MRIMSPRPDHQAIRERAFELFKARGSADGYAMDDWLQAERELLDEQSPAVTPSPTKAVDESVQQSFPASDPPASRIPDEPPVNAGEKWAAAVEAAERGECEVTPFANPVEGSAASARSKAKGQKRSTSRKH
jgi:Protein of unknown function (DUF2934)